MKYVDIDVRGFELMPKIVSDETGTVLFGFKLTANQVWKYQIENDCIVSMTEVQPMIHSRSWSFACLYVPQKPGVIVVAGGIDYSAKKTNKCEIYNTESNSWSELPPLNETKSSCSICFIRN